MSKNPRAAQPCQNCNGEIVGRVLNALDCQWHPKCFVCSQCDRSVTEGGAAWFALSGPGVKGGEGKVWCPNCQNWFQKEKGTGSFVRHNIVIETLQNNDDPLRAFVFSHKATCVACQQQIPDKFVQIEQGKYHAGCVRCKLCDVLLPNGFIKVAGLPHCSPCATKAKESRGIGAKGTISGSVIVSAPVSGGSNAIASAIRSNNYTVVNDSAAIAAPTNTKTDSSDVCGNCGEPKPPTIRNAWGAGPKFCTKCGTKVV